MSRAWWCLRRGRKRINLGKDDAGMGDGSNFLLTSVDLPVVSQVIAATETKPMLGTGAAPRDGTAVREILSQQEFHAREESGDARGMAVGVSSACTAGRMLPADRPAEHTPQDIEFLSGLIQREIVYRLLRSPQGKTFAGDCDAGRAEPQGRRGRWSGCD